MRLVIRLLTYLVVAAATQTGLAAPLKVIQEIKVGGPDGWDYATFEPLTHTLYVAHGSAVSSVDVVTKTAIAHLADAQGAHAAVPYAAGRMLLITHGKANTITLNDATTGAVRTTVAVDTKPDAALLEPVTGRAFVMANGAGIVDVIDVETHQVTARIPVGGAPEAAAIDGHGLLYTHLEDHDAIVVIDARTQKVKATYQLDDCQEPSGIAYVTKGNLLLSACKNGIARLSRADNGAEIAKLPIGERPDAALYDATRGRAFVPCGDGTLTVIDFNAGPPHISEVVATKAGARTGAIDPATGLVYLPTGDLLAPAKAGDRPTVVPDTLKVLVIGH